MLLCMQVRGQATQTGERQATEHLVSISNQFFKFSLLLIRVFGLFGERSKMAPIIVNCFFSLS